MFLRSSPWTSHFLHNESEDSPLDCSPKLTTDFASCCRSSQGLTALDRDTQKLRAPGSAIVSPHLMKLRSYAFVLGPFVLTACMVSDEVARKKAACGDLAVAISTVQRVPTAFGGEEYVFATVSGPDGHLGR